MEDKDHYLAQKKGGSHPTLLGPIEDALVDYVVPKIPRFIETYHLTLTTIAWSFFIALFGYLSVYSPVYLLAIVIMIFLQWITDLFDGAVGRHRNTGLVRWGFYADHFLDYVFLISIFLGLHFYLEQFAGYNPFHMLIIGLCAIGLFVNSALVGAANKELKVDVMKIGPSEMRLLAILVFLFFYFFGASPLMVVILPLAILSCAVVLVTFILAGADLWKIDMKLKK